MRRDARNLPYIPGSTLKGVVRENCERLSRTLGFPEPCDPHDARLSHPDAFRPLKCVNSQVEAIFGTKYEGGRLFFRDARLKEAPSYDRFFQTRVMMNRKLGTVKDKHLFSTEYALPSTYMDMRFNTQIDGQCRNLLCSQPGDIPLAFCLLIAGILGVERLGGDKSTGGGRVQVDIDLIQYNDAKISLDDVLDYLEYYAGLAPELFSSEDESKGRGCP
jgi:CRISPR/Cas system CSM-associated protein Csm3 (group 7 of RAMP superfamily)